MATELGKAYVQIIPSAKGIGSSISSALNGEASSAGKSAGFNLVGALKGVIAAAGIGKVLKDSLEAGGNLQQSFGGLDTLYGSAAEGAKKYAAEAAKAGISANTYAEQAVSFGAALKSAYSNDTTAAMEAANVAILDMADNSAKMGTDIGSVQAAYQGFARGQYQLLDNLKLGYGGTKSEMERLLARASEISKVEYNIDNLGDVYKAIHVIQEDLGLTGVAADEAKTTFTGSLGAMKAAGENLLANLSLGQDITPSLEMLGETVETFLFNNLFPMVSNILSALPDLLSGVGSMLISGLNLVSNNADQIVSQGIEIVSALVQAIVQAAPYLVEAAVNLAMALGSALMNTDWAQVGSDLMNALKGSISVAASEILGTDDSTIGGILQGIQTGFPKLLEAGVSIISGIGNSIISALPSLITIAGQLITQFISFITLGRQQLIIAGLDIITSLIQGLTDNFPQIAASAVQAIVYFCQTIISNLPQVLSQGITIIGKLVAGLISAIPLIVASIPQLIQAIVNGFGSFDWGSIGRNLVRGIADGLKNAAHLIVDAAKDAAKKAFDAAKDFLGINSPALKGIYIGQMYDEGIAEGISRNKGYISDAVTGLSNQLSTGFKANPSFNFQDQSDDSKMDLLISLLNNYLPQIAEKEGFSMNDVFNGINRQLGWGVQ